MPEAEGAARAWTRALNLVGNRVYFGSPDEPAYPLIICFRVGGGPVAGDVPIDQAMLQWDVWGDPLRDGKDRYDIAQLATDLRTEIESLASGTMMSAGVVALGGSVESGPLWLPEPNTGQARYVVTGTISMRVSSAA